MASCLLSSPRIHSPPDSLMRRTSVTKVSGNRVFQQAASGKSLVRQQRERLNLVLDGAWALCQRTCIQQPFRNIDWGIGVSAAAGLGVGPVGARRGRCAIFAFPTTACFFRILMVSIPLE